MTSRFVRTWTSCWAVALLISACSSSDDAGGIGSGGSGLGGAGGTGLTSGSGGSSGGQIVNTAGGIVHQDGLTISIPAGAVVSDTAVTVFTAPSPAGYALASAAYQFGPSGTTFAKPITVTLPLTSPTPDAHLFWSNASGGFDDLGGTVSGLVLTGNVSHFSIGFAAVPIRDGGQADAPGSSGTSGAGGQAGTSAAGGTGGTTGAGGASNGGAGGTTSAGGATAGGGTAGMTGGAGAGGVAGHDAGDIADSAAGASGNGGAADASAGSGGGGAAGTGGNVGNDAAAESSTESGTAEAGADASSSDAGSIDASALCAATGLNLPVAKVTYADAAVPPDGSTYSGGTIASGRHYLTAVTHYGGGLYTGSNRAQYVIDTNAGTIQIGEFTTSGAVYVGMTYVQLDANTLEATVVCNTGDGGTGTSQYYFTVSVSAQGSALTMTSIGSSDVLTIGPP